MQQVISKSQFKPKALEYLRQVQVKKQPLTITHFGKPVVKIVPYTQETEEVFATLRGTVVSYQRPTEPVGEKDWEASQ